MERIEKHPQHPMNIEKDRLEALSKRWNDTMRGVVENVAEHLGREIPSFEPSHVAHLLEVMTEPRLREKTKQSNFVVISSIAGGGKSTIGKILETMGFDRLPRVTTRAPRPGEIEGHDYEFIDRARFDEELAAGAYAYSKDTYGEGRAIRKSALDERRASGKKFYAEGDALAYDTIRTSTPGYADLSYVSIFLIPDSFDTALARLQGRIQGDIEKGVDPHKAVADAEERIEKALHYLEESGGHITKGVYDGYLVNDDLDRVRTYLGTLFA